MTTRRSYQKDYVLANNPGGTERISVEKGRKCGLFQVIFTGRVKIAPSCKRSHFYTLARKTRILRYLRTPRVLAIQKHDPTVPSNLKPLCPQTSEVF